MWLSLCPMAYVHGAMLFLHFYHGTVTRFHEQRPIAVDETDGTADARITSSNRIVRSVGSRIRFYGYTIAFSFRESIDVQLRSVSIERNSASPTKHNKTWYAGLARIWQQVYFRTNFLMEEENPCWQALGFGPSRNMRRGKFTLKLV